MPKTTYFLKWWKVLHSAMHVKCCKVPLKKVMIISEFLEIHVKMRVHVITCGYIDSVLIGTRLRLSMLVHLVQENIQHGTLI